MKVIEVSQHADGALYAKTLGQYLNRIELHQLKRAGRKIVITNTKTKLDVTKLIFATVSVCTFCNESYQLRVGAGDAEDMDDSCCAPCDRNLIVANQQFHAKEAAKFAVRACRTCGEPCTVGRYYNCSECLPEYRLPSEDKLAEAMPDMRGVTQVSIILAARATAVNKGTNE